MESKQPVSDGQKAPDTQHTGVILATIGDTTWRMFVPTIGFTLIGLAADYCYGTKPWLMVAGIALGFAVSFSLVWLQVAQIRRQEPKK